MKDPEPGMTWAEYLESLIPDGPRCWGCGNIEKENGCCVLWGHEITSNTKKCKWCIEDNVLKRIRNEHKALAEF